MIRTEKDATRLVEIVDAFLAERRAGRAPSIEKLRKRHPDLAADLDKCLGCLELMDHGLSGGKPEAGGGGAIVGALLGDFRIIREVGRGGMGVVYEAEQVSLGRRVALKVLPFAAVFDERHLHRFRNEAQAAACLHHTNIVPVHAVGQERGVHYYAMQYIEGRSLAQIVDELRRGTPETSQPRSALTKGSNTRSIEYSRAVARIGIQAAEALAHAHERGVVHRDIKPANLMVDALGHLWVTDFGLASFERNVGLTLTGDLLGTVRYMSPEQALAKRVPLDHRTDIYSLGVTLYELLTLEPAFPGENPREVMHAIAFRDPIAARKLNPMVPVDLETVLLKAMAKDPGDRYASASDLAEDLERFLNRESVRAKRPSLVDVAGKWVARHRTAVAAALVVLVMTTGALAVSAYRISQEQRKTHAALGRATTSLELADAAVRKFLVEIGVKGFVDRPLPGPARRKLLEQALEFYETVPRDQPLAKDHLRRALVLHELHRYPEALEACDRALELARGEGYALAQRGHMLWHEGRLAEAEQALDAAIAADPNTHSPWFYKGIVLSDLKRHVEALGAFDHAVELAPEFAGVHVNRGVALLELGRPEEALAAQDRAIELDPTDVLAHLNRANTLQELGRLEESLRAYDHAIQLAPGSAVAHSNRGSVLLDLGRPEDALAACDRAIELDPTLASAHMNRGNALQRLRRPEESLAAQDRAIDFDPTNSLAHSNRGSVLFDCGRLEDGLAACDRAIQLDPNCAPAYANRGTALLRLGRLEDSLAACDRAIELDPRLAGAHGIRGLVLRRLGRLEPSLAACDRATELAPNLAIAHANRGLVLQDLGRFEDSLLAFDRAIELDPTFATAERGRGDTLQNLGRLEESLAAYDRAIELGSPCHNDRGIVLIKLGRLEEALSAFDRAIELAQADANVHANRGLVLIKLGRLEEALTAWDRAIALDPAFALPHVNRSIALYNIGRFEESLAAADRAIELDPGNIGARVMRGDALRRLSRLEEAVSACDRAIELAPTNAGALAVRGKALAGLGRRAEALASMEQAVRRNPTQGDHLAWWLCTSEDTRVRDPERAAGFARTALSADPENPSFLATLGTALYRCGRYEEAASRLSRAVQLHEPASRSAGAFFLAMACSRLQRPADAREWYDKAVAWMEEHAPDDEELERFRAEAEEVLGIRAD